MERQKNLEELQEKVMEEWVAKRKAKAKSRTNSEKERYRGARRQIYKQKLYKRDVEPILKLPNEFREAESELNPLNMDWMDSFFENYSKR
jgi:hypothetical protein